MDAVPFLYEHLSLSLSLPVHTGTEYIDGRHTDAGGGWYK